jgi:hypothetical protein
MTEPNVAWQGTEQRDSVSNEHGHASDNEALNYPRTQEILNRNPTVDIEVVGAAGSKLRNDLSRRPGHLFHNATNPGKIDRATTQDHHAFVTIGPAFHGQNRLEGLATNHNRVNSCYEFVVSMGFAAARRQKVEIAIRSRNEAVDAGADKDRDCGRRLLLLTTEDPNQ